MQEARRCKREFARFLEGGANANLLRPFLIRPVSDREAKTCYGKLLLRIIRSRKKKIDRSKLLRGRISVKSCTANALRELR